MCVLCMFLDNNFYIIIHKFRKKVTKEKFHFLITSGNQTQT